MRRSTTYGLNPIRQSGFILQISIEEETLAASNSSIIKYGEYVDESKQHLTGVKSGESLGYIDWIDGEFYADDDL